MSETTGSQTAPPPGPPPGPPPAPEAGRRLLRRSRSDRKLAGVAGGMAQYFAIDPLLVRIAFVVLAVAGDGIGLLLYIACAFLVPEEGAQSSTARYFIDRHGKLLAIIAAILVFSALLTSGPWSWGPHHGPWLFFVGLIGFAVYWILRGRHPHPVGPPTSTPWTTIPPVPSQPSPYAASAQQSSQPSAQQGVVPTPAYAAQTPTPTATAPYAMPSWPPPTVPPTPPGQPMPLVPPAPPRERSALGPLTVGAALLTAGTLVAFDRGDVWSVPAVVVLASALLVVGLGLIVGSVIGRSRGLVVLGVVLSIVTAIAGVVHLPSTSQTGSQVWAPVSVAEVQPSYEWGAGDTRLDLGTVSSPTPVSTKVDLGVGQLVVVVPRTAIVHLRAHVGAGAIDTYDADDIVTTVGGFGRDVDTTLNPATPTTEKSGAAKSPTATTFDLDLSVGIGHVEVRRA